jgi:hypothetical protein
MHVRRDLEAIAEAARADLGVPIDVAEFLGAHPAIPGLLAEIAREKTSGASSPR